MTIGGSSQGLFLVPSRREGQVRLLLGDWAGAHVQEIKCAEMDGLAVCDDAGRLIHATDVRSRRSKPN